MKKSIAKYVNSCDQCARNKYQKHVKEPMQQTTTPANAFEVVSIDTVGPFTKSANNNRYAITLQCDLTKYIAIIPISEKDANTVARAIVNEFILRYGPMKYIKTDLGTEYKNQVFEEVCKYLKIKHLFATVAHPETIGALERNHKCLNEYLRSFVNDTRDDWDSWIPYYVYCYNTTPNSVHKYTPFELVFGKTSDIPAEFPNKKPDPIYNHDLYSKELKFRLQTSIAKAKQHIINSKITRTTKENTNREPLDVRIGDKVLVEVTQRRKMDPLYEGPYTVVEISNTNCKLKSNNRNIEVHKNKLRKLA